MRLLLSLLSVGLVSSGMVGCEQSDPADESPASTTGLASSQQTEDGSDESATHSDMEEPDEPGTVKWRLFEVQGAQIWAYTGLVGLPERASLVRFSSAMIIDEGEGPMLCMGGVLDSLPLQCGGPKIEDLDMDGDWVESSQDTRWGSRALTVQWPVVENVVIVTEIGATEAGLSAPVNDFALPEHCEDIETFVDVAVLEEYADDHPDTVVQLWGADGGTKGVLQVLGDLDQVRADLAEEEGEPCLEQARYSRGQLEEVQDKVNELFGNEELGINSTGLGKENRVRVGALAPDLTTVEKIIEAAGEPEALLIIGGSTILE